MRVTGLQARRLALMASLILLALTGGAAVLWAAPQPAARPDAYQLLTNPGLETYQPPYGQWHGVNCQVATGWQPQTWGDPPPCWMDTRVFAYSPLGTGWVERIEGETSQLIVGTEPYTATLHQQVGGLAPGAGYGFHAALLSIYQSSAQPRVDGTMIKRVGLDPSGGTDPRAPGVTWSEPDATDKAGWVIQSRTAAFAAGPAVTVFIQVDSRYPAGPWPFMNLAFFDSAILAQTPDVEATSPALSPEPEFEVGWDNVTMPPAGGTFQGVDVQWRDEAEVEWRNWLAQTFAVTARFEGEPGHTYRFRARAWASYPNGAWLHGPYRAQGDTATTVASPGLAGRVLSHDGLPVLGATVALSGTAYSATSGPDGRYLLSVPPLGGDQAATVTHSAWQSPPPAFGLSLPLTGALPLTWTLLPAGDAFANGGFEEALDGWSVAPGGGVTPTTTFDAAHTGHAGLALGGAWPAAYTAAVSQTVTLSAAWEPALSLWYRPLSGGAGDSFSVRVTVHEEPWPATRPLTSSLVLTPSLTVSGWQHVWARVGPPAPYLTATVSVEFLLREGGDPPAAAVFVDEVVLGPTRGGPRTAHLPLVRR